MSVERVPFPLDKEPLFVRLGIIYAMIIFQNCHDKNFFSASVPVSIFFLVYNVLVWLVVVVLF